MNPSEKVSLASPTPSHDTAKVYSLKLDPSAPAPKKYLVLAMMQANRYRDLGHGDNFLRLHIMKFLF